MMKYKQLKTTVFLLVVLFVPCLTQATILGTVDMAHTGFYANDIITVSGGYLYYYNVDAGVYKLKVTGGTDDGKYWADEYVGAFCIELAEPHTSTPLTYNVIEPSDGPVPTNLLGQTMGNTKAKYLQELWGRYYDPSWVTSTTYTSAQNDAASAFAAAIWEIVHEDFTGSPLNWDVTVDGTYGPMGFSSPNVNSELANDWLHSLDGTGPMADLRVFSYDGYQDFLVAVPEPATIALLGIGSVFGLMRRKKRTVEI